jgi:hypothetical protein
MLVRRRQFISAAWSTAGSGHTFSAAAADGLYEVLGLDRTASTEDIKSAFRRVTSCLLQHHQYMQGLVQCTNQHQEGLNAESQGASP